MAEFGSSARLKPDAVVPVRLPDSCSCENSCAASIPAEDIVEARTKIVNIRVRDLIESVFIYIIRSVVNMVSGGNTTRLLQFPS